METIHPYVLSSRTLGRKNGRTTYQTEDTTGEKEKDESLDYFNFGRYNITIDQNKFRIDFPNYITFNDHEEIHHFRNYADAQVKPGKETQKLFEEVFTSLKKTDKILYIYLHGFGNNVKSEMNKQVLPMAECYYPYDQNFHSPVGEMIFFTWPSHGFTEYKHGEKYDVSKMAGMISIFFLKLYYFVKDKTNPLFADGWQPRIVFHSQSMGCKILLNVVQRVNALEERNMIKKNLLHGFFYRIVMTGADIDVDAMNDEPDENGEEIHQWAQRVVLFSNEKDVALWISKYIFTSGKRLGRHLDEEGMKLLPINVDIVQLKGKKNDFIGHNYFTEEPTVVVGLQKILSEFYFDGTALENRGRKILLDFNDYSVKGEWMRDRV